VSTRRGLRSFTYRTFHHQRPESDTEFFNTHRAKHSLSQISDSGRGLQGRGRGFDMGSITLPDRSLQRQKKPSVTLVFCKLRPSFSLSRQRSAFHLSLSGLVGFFFFSWRYQDYARRPYLWASSRVRSLRRATTYEVPKLGSVFITWVMDIGEVRTPGNLNAVAYSYGR
jgi:hypothetical protein